MIAPLWDLGESLSSSPLLGRVKLRRVELPEGAAEDNGQRYGVLYHHFYRKRKTKNFALVGIPELRVKQKWPTLEIGVQARKRWPRWS